MKQVLSAKRDTVVFDCDGVFYSWNVFGGMGKAMDFCADVKVEATARLLPFLNAKEAADIGRRSYEETGDGLTYFVSIAEENGMDGAEFREQMHMLYHQILFAHVRERVPSLLTPCLETSRLLYALSSRVQFGVLSQGCRDNWITPLFEERGISNYFKPANIYGFKEFGWNEKSASAKGLSIVMEAMEVDPSQVVFVEDTFRNLRPVKETYEDVATVHIPDWQTPAPEDDYIDLSFASNMEFLRSLHAAHRDATPTLQRTHDPLGFNL